MKFYRFASSYLLILSLVTHASGHGLPIHVHIADDALVVSQGIPDDGFAKLMFFEDDDEGLPFGELSLDPVGSVVLWNLPGLDIVGMNDAASLLIEPLSRPVRGSHPLERRLVWYWNPLTEEVESSAAPFYLLNGASQFVTLPWGETNAIAAPLLLADPIEGEQGFHNHSLLYYALDDNSDAPIGAYGIFARLKSDSYESSEAFLLVFNHGIAYNKMPTAAKAINFAADNLPGDYNDDGIVDAADYVVWRDTVGSMTNLIADGDGNESIDIGDHGVWRENFGTGADLQLTAVAIPEPSSLGLLLFTAYVFVSMPCGRLLLRRVQEGFVPA